MNPKENATIITLRSGKQLEEVSSKPNEPSQLETKPLKSKSPLKVTFKDPIASTIPPSFPSRLAKSNKEIMKKRCWRHLGRSKLISLSLMPSSKCQDMLNFSKNCALPRESSRGMKLCLWEKIVLPFYKRSCLQSLRIRAPSPFHAP